MQKSEEKNLSVNKTHFINLKKVLSLWPNLSILETDFLSEIRMIMAVNTDHKTTATMSKSSKNFIIVEKNGNAYYFGSVKNKYGIKIYSQFDFEGNIIKTLIQNHMGGIYALTDKGEVYLLGMFGDNHSKLQGFLFTLYKKPISLTSLSNKYIVDIVCNKYHAFALTAYGKIFSWKSDYMQKVIEDSCQIPIQVISELDNKIIDSIGCGLLYTIFVTVNGEVYSCGSVLSEEQPSSYDQYYIRKIAFPEKIVKVACGSNHALALTNEGDLYVWGKNNYGQLGTGNTTDISDPVLLDTDKMGKLSDVAAVSTAHISVVYINEDRCIYIWGLYDNCSILIPHATSFTNIYDIFASENIMYTPLTILSADEYPSTENLLKCLEVSFDDSSTSDFKFQIEQQVIHVHKAILKIRSSYFRTMFQHDWKENTENILKIDMISYNVYKAYLQYLYTDQINISLAEVLDLLELADMYNEINLRTDCISIIEKMITIRNVCSFYNKTIEYNEKELEEFCSSFIVKNFQQVVHTDSFTELEKNTIIKFLREGVSDLLDLSGLYTE